MRTRAVAVVANGLFLLAVAGCSSAGGSPDATPEPADAAEPIFDAEVPGAIDAGKPDARPPDADLPDAPPPPPDAAPPDASTAHPVLFTGANPTTQFGNVTGGSVFDDACPTGEALIGFSGSLSQDGGFHRQIAALCGHVERFGTAGSYAIQVGTGVSLPVRGLLAGTFSWIRKCPADQVLSGFVGRSGQLIDQLTLSCVPLVVDAAGGTSITLGAVTVLPAIGGAGGTAFAQTDCPAGQVATVARLRAGDSLDAFGLACSVPSVAP
jgi:hypothetical protein